MKKREMIEAAARGAGAVFEGVGSVPPMYDGLTGDGTRFLMPIPPSFSRDETIELARRVFAEGAVTIYVFMTVTEAWMTTKRSGQPDERREIVVFIAEDAEGVLIAERAIVRPEGEKPQLEPLEFKEFTEAVGLVVGLLGRAPGQPLN